MDIQGSEKIRSRLEDCTLEALRENTPSDDSNPPPQPRRQSSPKDRNSRMSKLGPLWSIKTEDITISECVNLLRRWSESGVGLKSPEDHYEYTCTVETHRTLNKILRRFLTVSYYDIISELNATKRRCSTTEDGGFAFVVAVICQSGKYDRDTVRNKVKNWVKVGRRYRGFMAALCPGCLILFPEKISELVWEQYVPTKGEGFDKAIQLLQGLGIVDKCKEEGWNDLSNKVLQTLRVLFQSPIPFQFQPGQQYRIECTANSSVAPVAGSTKNGLIKVKSNVGLNVRELYLKSGFNSATASKKRKNEEIADTRPARTANTTTNHNSISTPSSNEVSISSISSHTISPSSPGDANSPLGNLPHSSLLNASSSERHALIDVPSIAERSQVLSITRAVVFPKPPAIPSDSNCVQGFFSNRSRVSYSPSPPQALLISENLFYNIKVYFENSCRNMILDDHGTLLAPNGAKLHNDLCNDFDSYCFTATMFIEKGLYVEFRRALSKASALVEQILRAEHPRTLACFLEVFIHLIQTGLPGVTSFLRDFIKRMSAKVTRKGHPWGEICRLLGELDSESLEQAMAQTWKCTTDIFDSELGTFSRLAVSVRVDYIKRVYGITNYFEEERLLRDLLARFGGIPGLPTPRMMLNLAHNLNRQGRHDEAEEMALEVLSLLQEYEIYAGRIVERIESVKIASRSQFNQGETLAAEQTMRRAIRMIVDQWGIQHSWVPEFMNVLEGWLRGWGREEDANTLRGEIEELMGKDEIDEQLDRAQGLLC